MTENNRNERSWRNNEDLVEIVSGNVLVWAYDFEGELDDQFFGSFEFLSDAGRLFQRIYEDLRGGRWVLVLEDGFGEIIRHGW